MINIEWGAVGTIMGICSTLIMIGMYLGSQKGAIIALEEWKSAIDERIDKVCNKAESCEVGTIKQLLTFRLDKLEKKMDKHNEVQNRMSMAEFDIKIIKEQLEDERKQ